MVCLCRYLPYAWLYAGRVGWGGICGHLLAVALLTSLYLPPAALPAIHVLPLPATALLRADARSTLNMPCAFGAGRATRRRTAPGRRA